MLGSASPDLLRQSSETLAGRIAFVEMAGFDLDEVSPQKWRRLLLRGGFPPSFLARSDGASFEWREAFVRTFIERDLAALNVEVRSRDNVRRLWSMLAHRHAQLWNGAEIAGALGETYPTVKRHLDILRGALVVRQLPPFLPNAEKRLVKAHKVYIRDSGVLHALLDIRSLAALEGHPQLGAAWEGFVVEEVVRRVGERAAFFWGTHGGAELDLLVVRGRSRVGFEMKWGDAPKATKSMYAALADLNLKNLHVIYPGDVRYPLAPRIDVVPITMLDEVL